MKTVEIDREVLQCLADVADVAVFDLTDGLSDGTYEEDCLNGWTSGQVSTAIERAQACLDPSR